MNFSEESSTNTANEPFAIDPEVVGQKTKLPTCRAHRFDDNGATVAGMPTRHLTSCLALALASELWVNCGFAAATEEGDANTTDDGASKASDSNASESPSSEAKAATHSAAADQTDAQDRGFPHAGQFSLRLALVAAERIVSRYDESPTCGNDDEGAPKKFCGYGAPLALDFALGFAPLKSVEPFAWARFGLTGESVTHTQPLIILGVGARLYTMSDSAFKFFLQPSVGWELEAGTGSAPYDGRQYKKDFLIQLLAGPQYDFAKNIGAYLGFGITAGMLRAIQTWMELDVGVQARF